MGADLQIVKTAEDRVKQLRAKVVELDSLLHDMREDGFCVYLALGMGGRSRGTTEVTVERIELRRELFVHPEAPED